MKHTPLIAVLLIPLFSAAAFGQDGSKRTEARLAAVIQELAEANLRSDTRPAEKYFADEMIMTSQSGKVYERKDALQDIKNAFEKYENSEFRFVHLDGRTVVVSYQNLRKRRTLDEAKFRVTAVWTLRRGGWKLVSLQSSRIAAQGM